MKQYLSPEQTAKLMELGFEQPIMKNILDIDGIINEEWYSIGELMEILPCKLYTGEIYIDFNGLWRIGYRNTVLHISEFELIDALYEMIIVLKKNMFYEINSKSQKD